MDPYQLKTPFTKDQLQFIADLIKSAEMKFATHSKINRSYAIEAEMILQKIKEENERLLDAKV